MIAGRPLTQPVRCTSSGVGLFRLQQKNELYSSGGVYCLKPLQRRPKMKNTWMITAIAVVSLCLASTSTWAGSKQQYRWEGVAIGVGAAIVGSALINNHLYGHHGGPSVALSFNYRETHRHPPRYHGSYKRNHGDRHNHWRSHVRRPQYRSPYRHGYSHGYGHRKSWHSHGRGASGGHGSRQHGAGGRRK
jgi:hypothetical protein